ncbi:MAG: B12-binding domain-containing radical SAM protein [Clostridiales bacterium]|jgi:radical SAM superfamily enzyme YgiQ (UPF0313 family)|nr:B12-binding domain-containing radical SAM protein [Clostridiales bacterium]
MKILLIQPKMNKRPMDTELKTRMSPPLGLLTLIALTPIGHEIILVNENTEEIDFSFKAGLVGITITLDVMPRAIQIAEIFRNNGVPVVAGGIHVTCSPDSCLQYFDSICVGPAERVWAKIIMDAEAGNLQNIYHDMDGFLGSEIIAPDFNHLDRGKYLYTNIISTSRGCPNRCSFCYNSSGNRAYALRTIESVVKEIRSLGTKHILFIDDNFIGCPQHTKELLGNFIGMGLKWSAAVTSNIADYPELLDLMAKTGCQSLFIGFESINNESLLSVNKDNSFEKYGRLVNEIHSRGIMINASMVFGLDGDMPDVFERSLNWLVQNKVETLTLHILTPYPGTELYKSMLKEGRVIDKDLSKYNTANVVFRPKNMSSGELYKGYLWIYKQFYSFKNIMRRMPKSKKQIIPYLLFNFSYRKFGKLTALLSNIAPLNKLGKIARFISYNVK